MSDCPVCGKVGVDDAATRCPQCHADLECFALLDALHEEAPAPGGQADLAEVKQTLGRLQVAVQRGGAGSGRRSDWPVLTALAGLAALILATQLVVVDHRPAEPTAMAPTRIREPAATAAAMEEVTGGIERLADRLGVIERRLDDLAAEQSMTTDQAPGAGKQATEIAEHPHGIEDELARLSATAAQVPQDAAAMDTVASVAEAPEVVLHHHLRRGETLWSIAKRYYGRGQLYPVLIEQNPGLGPYHRGIGILRILADPDEAAELYRRITPPGGEGRLFRYRVEPGDDWRKLAARFLGRPDRAPELIALNPRSDLKPGERVLIALE